MRKVIYSNHWQIPKNFPTLYRALSYSFEDGITRINVQSYPIVKYTAQGVWISNFGFEKFVNLRALRRWAHLTEAAALDALKHRKIKQIQILEQQMRNAKITLELLAAGKLHNCEQSPQVLFSKILF